MRSVLRAAIAVLVIPVLLLQSIGAVHAAETDNPLIDPHRTIEYTSLPDRMVNILLMGIDLGADGYWGSGHKKDIGDCHTDAVMVIAINLDKHEISLLSLPRDTVTYVPGVRGIYKLNAAVNCAESLEEGLQNTRRCVEWLLGGVKIDYYFAVDMGTMIALGDAIGGIDFDVEMRYHGHSGQWYSKGLQHLDGIGITDYLRARTNATVNGTDIGRTNRQREIILAAFEKLRSDENMIWNLLETAAAQYNGFFTDITMAVLVQLVFILPDILSVNAAEIGTYVLEGPYRSTLDWNFTYTDQDHRISVLKQVYGMDAKPIPYVSRQYAQWLLDGGFSAVKTIAVSQELRDYAQEYTIKSITAEQRKACDAFETAYQQAVTAFDAAAISMAGEDEKAMHAAKNELREAAQRCAEALDYDGKMPWSFYSVSWWEDTYINEYQIDWR